MDPTPVLQWIGASGQESYESYLRDGIVHRKTKPKKHPQNEMGDFYAEWIRFLEEKCLERLLGRESLGRVSTETLVSWLAHRVYDVPAQAIAEYYGYGSPATVRANCTRLQERMEEDLEFREALESATKLTTLKG